MDEPSSADLIWDRACKGDLYASLPGDLALDVLFAFHGCTMNGGIFHALESLGERVPCAKDAYRYFGHSDVADLISETEALVASCVDLEPYEAPMDIRYLKLIPSDKTLFNSLETALRDKPGEFAPL